MALNLASPGILVREVDLTIGRIDGSTGKVGGIVGPFEKGPVDVPVTITGENEYVDQFGTPHNTDKQYETWMVGSSYLAYGGVLSVIRADDDGLKNGTDTSASIKIRSSDHYTELGYDLNQLTTATVAAKNPGSWSNGLRVAIIDGAADQIITLNDANLINVGVAVTQTVPANTTVNVGAGATSNLTGYFKGIVTGIGTTAGLAENQIQVKVLSHVNAAGIETARDFNSTYKFGTVNGDGSSTIDFPNTGAGTTSAIVTRGFGTNSGGVIAAGVGITAFFNTQSGTLDNIGNAVLSATGTAIGIDTTGLVANDLLGSGKFLLIDSEVISLTGADLNTPGQITLSGAAARGVELSTAAEHSDGATVKFLKRTAVPNVGTVKTGIGTHDTTIEIAGGTDLKTILNSGGLIAVGTELLSVNTFLNGNSSQKSVQSTKSWYDEQTYAVTTSTKGGSETVVTAKWNEIADAPGTSEFAATRGGRFDEVHVVVIDAKGTVTGNAGTILEKHLNLSKAKDGVFSVGSPSYWRQYLYTNSENLFGLSGSNIGLTTTGFTGANFTEATNGGWDQDAEGIIFNASGKQDLVLTGGKNYGGKDNLTDAGSLDSGLDDLISGYGKFENDTTVNVDFLLMGSGKYGRDSTRALAEKLITVAELRQDAVAFISPHRGAMITDTSSDTADTILSDSDITDNVVEFYDTISSTTFAVFDSGYKYMYDRFNNTFRYVPLNGDIAGTCARNDINDFPWFSPAGTDRGSILNAVKLPYNPTKIQRDKLYSNRINPVIFSPGAGIVLFGDKTGFAKASAFDRINVRRLFIFLENGISAAAKDQLFEFNDEITRANFVNIVEPFLRDVQSKRGIQDYVVICDETNNTAAVIDNNEFIADIFVKPARSINFIGLTFVATRTGVSFEEVIGSV